MLEGDMDVKAFAFSVVAFVALYVGALMLVLGLAETRALFWRIR